MWTKAEEHVVKIEKVYCKENCIDRSVKEPIIIDFCDDDSDDDTGWSIIILSIIDRKKKCKNRINVTLKPMPKIFGTIWKYVSANSLGLRTVVTVETIRGQVNYLTYIDYNT